MNHSFNVDIAQIYGVNEAILIENLAFWILKNKANKKHFYENKWWTYNSISSFNELFPYWTKRQISHILKKLKEYDIINTGNFNKSHYDRTLWYSLNENVLSIYENCKMKTTNLQNENNKSVSPIPDINTDINTDESPIVPFENFLDKEFEIKFVNQKPIKRTIADLISKMPNYYHGNVTSKDSQLLFDFLTENPDYPLISALCVETKLAEIQNRTVKNLSTILEKPMIKEQIIKIAKEHGIK